jgi:hypothetical protein
LCLFAYSGVQHILCCVFVCFSSSCVPYVASFSGLFLFVFLRLVSPIGDTRRRKTNKNTTQYVLNTTIRKQTQIMLIRYELSYKQLEVNTNRTSSLCGNRVFVCFSSSCVPCVVSFSGLPFFDCSFGIL